MGDDGLLQANRAVTGDAYVGTPAACCHELIKPREAILTCTAGTREIALHVGCVSSVIEAAPRDLLDFPSAERLRQLIST
jgi:hypothetical protein